ncbi:MAG: hypothetical protein AAF555_06570 [Verrucomicrobiota bacterium]
MDPESEERLRVHRATLDKLAVRLSGIDPKFQRLRRADLKSLLSQRFGVWMKENSLPKPRRR